MRPNVSRLFVFAASICIPAGLPAQSADAATPETEITVFLAGLDSTPKLVWDTAQAKAAALYSRIGIRLRFTDVPPTDLSEVIQLRILRKAPHNIKGDVLGASFNEGENGRAVVIFYERVKDFNRSLYAEEIGIVLGYVVAHELGHILRNIPGHSPDGVMKARFTKKDIVRMLKDGISFSRNDSDQFHRILQNGFLATAASGPGHRSE